MDISTRLELAKAFSDVSEELREEAEPTLDVPKMTVAVGFMKISNAITKGGL